MRALEALHSDSTPERADTRLDLWRELSTGRWSLLDRFVSDGCSHFVARRNAPETAKRFALTPREEKVIARVAVGQPLKVVAYELGVSLSTVTNDRARATRKLGVRALPELAPLLRAALIEPSQEPVSELRRA
jgi:DNA-binding CsgD family transcriptional regulator